MHVFIWQQFSSNHSASFTAVGKFRTPEEADRAAANIRDILRQLEQWRQLNDPTGQLWFDRIELGETTPIERELAREYAVDWPHGVSWFYWMWYPGVTEPVMVFDRYVIIENPFWEVRYTPQPFDNLLKRFGGEVAVAVTESRSHLDTDYVIDLRFAAPTEATAQILEAQWQTYLSTPWESGAIPPWLAYHAGQRDPRAEQLCILAEQYLLDLQSPSQINGRLYHQIEIAEMRQDLEEAERLKQRYEALYQQGQIHLTRDEYRWLETAINATDVDKDIYEAMPDWGYKITRNNNQLVIENIRDFSIHWGSLVKLLTAITVWLQDQQCTSIDFTFAELAG
jgi:hypothetical protein